jgi:hypothetical protein
MNGLAAATASLRSLISRILSAGVFSGGGGGNSAAGAGGAGDSGDPLRLSQAKVQRPIMNNASLLDFRTIFSPIDDAR